MRSLATAKYSAAEVEQRLTEDAPIGFEVDITDKYGSVIETLPSGPTGDVGVLLDSSAMISCNREQKIKSELRLTMRPVERLRNRPFQYWLRCRGLLGMRDGKMASFTLGSYVVDPIASKALPSTSGIDEWWTIAAGDGTYLLERTGPPPAFEAVKGERISDAINRVLARAGMVGRVPRVDVVLQKTFTYRNTKPKVYERYEILLARWEGVLRNGSDAQKRLAKVRVRALKAWVSTHVLNQGTVTWLVIANELLGSVGFEDLWFDWDGKPRIEPAKDPTKVGPQVVYAAGGLLSSDVQTVTDHARRANQVTVRSVGDSNLLPLTVSADTYAPWHPLAPKNCGVTLPLTVDVAVDMTQQTQRARAVKELFKALGRHEKARFESLWHPGHELTDVVGLQMSGHPSFSDVTGLNTGQFSISPHDLGVAHEDERVWVA